MSSEVVQQDLFSEVLHAYAENPDQPLSNGVLYERVLRRSGMDPAEFRRRVPVGESGKLHRIVERKVRWHQQTLKRAGVLERVDSERGLWRVKSSARKDLSEIEPTVAVVGFSTDLGVAILGSCDHVFASMQEEIHLAVLSPPYPIAKGRAYGAIEESRYVDWLLKTLEPVIRSLAPGASLCLNVTNDRFVHGPARSLYVERLVLALHDRLGLYKCDDLIWSVPNKSPGPMLYASLQRTQLNVGYEHVLWFTNDPLRLRADNRRVLQAHTERHMRLMLRGGEGRTEAHSDGAHRLRQDSFARVTDGRIPRNVLTIGHTCVSQRDYKGYARSIGLPAHGAPFPLALTDFLVQFLTRPGDLVVDPMAGSFTSALSAERLGRRWIAVDLMLEYVFGAAWRFRDRPGYDLRLAA
jgi:site-specific DNA-methyltransferase (cytosine-N4-specific)